MIINKKLFAMETKKMILLIVVSLGLVTFLTGCERELVDSIPQSEVKTLEQIKETVDMLPWEKARYDYSYLEDKLGEANQYLTNNKLTAADLKQLHDIGNLLFGEYREKLAKNWETRTPDFIENLMDKTLFDSEYERRNIYSLISLDYDKVSEVEKAPNVRILTEHIGERGDYLFVTVRVYVPHFYGRDWGYTILQVKRAPESKYGWKVYYNEQEVPGFTDRSQTGSWTVELNEQDDFSDEAWKNQQGVITDQEWETRFTRERVASFRSLDHMMTRSNQSSKYNRQAAASYAYTYALSYNPDYYFWKDANNTDCANFASQCLAAGGLPQDATWKYFYNQKDPYSSGTSAWRGAKQLYDYLLKDPKRATKVPIEYMIDAYKNKPGAWCVLRWGDLVFLNRNKSGSLKHAMIITHSYNDLSKHYNGTPRYTLSAHTNDRRDVDIAGLDFDFAYLKSRGLGVKIEY